jgi:serine protease
MPARRPVLSFSVALSLLFLLGAIGCKDSNPTEIPLTLHSVPPVAYARGESHRKIDGEYIVVLDENEADVHGRATQLANGNGASVTKEYKSAIKGFAGRMSAAAADAIAREPGVSFVEQDQEVGSADVQSYAPSWGIDRIDQTQLPLDGQYTYAAAGSGVSVYIIDTGIRLSHSQFGGRALSGYTSVADGNGTDDCNWHGTHVAGTVGGATVGVAKQVTLYAVRVLDCNGSGTTSGVIAGVDWVTANRHLPAVANMSVSGGYSDALNAAIQNSINSGVTYVVAAGNSASDACTYSPSSVAAALTVGASEAGDQEASYSNFGPCVDLFAPGTGITSAWSAYDDGLTKGTGTSMASPHVAGAAALYLEVNPNATPADVARAVMASSTTNAITGLAANTPNRLLRVNGPSVGTVLSPPIATPVTPNAPPSASFAVNCASQKSYCSFDATTSSDDKRITSYSWSFGDGSSSVTASNPITSHTYVAKGTFAVTLVVLDDGGLSGKQQKTITIKSVSRR